MKKLFLTLGLASLFLVACNNTPKEQPVQSAEPAQVQEIKTNAVAEKKECPMEALKAEYANWDNMTDEAKAELNKKAASLFAEMQAKKAECEADSKNCCKEGKEECEKKMAEMTEEQKKECEAKQMKAAWENFANLSVDEQKDFIMKQLENCGGEKNCCKGEEGHQCQHEAK